MSSRSTAHRLRSDRGAILIQVAAALLSFTMLSAFVIDYGIILVSRHQIQNAADAAALAGATALAYDSYTDLSSTGPAADAAMTVARENLVWRDRPAATSADITFPYCGNPATPTGPVARACVQVDLFRDYAHGNPLPSYFGQLMGVSSTGPAASGVSARARAQTIEGNATDCLKPLAVPDRWRENAPVPGLWLPGSTFTKWDPAKPNVPLATRDSYSAPRWDFVGSGLTLAADFGTQAVIRPGSTAIPVSPISAWSYLPLRIAGSIHGNDLMANIEQCAASPVGIGDRLDLMIGAFSGPVTTGLQFLMNQDPGAHWNAKTSRIEGSCTDAHPRCASISPRLIAIAAYDVNDLADSSRFAPGASSVRVSNIVGFFLDSIAGTDVTGHITMHPGLVRDAATSIIDDSSFLRASLLVK
jgi:hypothetical protein